MVMLSTLQRVMPLPSRLMASDVRVARPRADFSILHMTLGSGVDRHTIDNGLTESGA
jgi:hypothetical protein